MASNENDKTGTGPAPTETPTAPNSLAASGDAAAITSTAATTSAVAPAQEPVKIETEKSPSPSLSAIETLWSDVQQHNHKEIWGVELADPATHIPSQIILQKYLNANDGDLAKAQEQLKNTLDWRAKTDPSTLIQRKYAQDKFAGLGYITSYADSTPATPDKKDVFTWNIYGGVKDISKTFGDLDAFIEWRVALMELAMRELDLSSAIKPITAEDDPYKIYQVHDYKSTSFFRSPPAVRAAAKKTVEVLAMAYPETLREKFFINVPAIMGFMYGVMKLFVAPKTIKKFHPMSNGGALALEFGDSKVQGLGEKLPKAYGGKGDELSTVGKEPLLE